MKSLVLGLATLVLSVNVLAVSEQYSMSWPSDRVESLNACKGSAQLIRRDGNFYLKVQDAASCSNISIQEADGQMVKVGKLKGGEGVEYIALNEHFGKNQFVVVAESNSGKTSATITVTSFVAPPPPKPPVATINPNQPADFVLSTYLFGRRSASLGDCGGTVTLHKLGGQAALYFQNVQKCSNFDILKANGEYTRFADQKIGTEGNRTDDIVIPGNMTEYGSNEIKVVVKSNSKKTYDIFKLQFFAW